MLTDLAEFLKLEPNERWIKDALSIMKIKPSYNHDSELLQFYRNYVSDKGSRFPELTKGLLLFIE